MRQEGQGYLWCRNGIALTDNVAIPLPLATELDAPLHRESRSTPTAKLGKGGMVWHPLAETGGMERLVDHVTGTGLENRCGGGQGSPLATHGRRHPHRARLAAWWWGLRPPSRLAGLSVDRLYFAFLASSTIGSSCPVDTCM